MKILVSGTTGLIGSALIPYLEAAGYTVVKLVRVCADLRANEIAWDPARGVINPPLLEGLDAVVHLAGESIMGRWTKTKKAKIRLSRVEGTMRLCQAIETLKKPPSVFICASAIGYYGDRGDEILTDHSTKGEGFLSDVCEEWEKASLVVMKKGIRTVNLRTGMVLSAKGGALKQMLPVFKWGMGGNLGSGTQWISWISLDDLLRAIAFTLKNDQLRGAVNAVAPFPVTNQVFTRTLGHLLRRPTFLTMPSFMVKLVFGELGTSLLLASQNVRPLKLEEAGFLFTYPHLEEALRALR